MNLRNRIVALEGGGGWSTEDLCAALQRFEQTGDLPPPGPLCWRVVECLQSMIAASYCLAASDQVEGSPFHNDMHERMRPWREKADRVRALLAGIASDDDTEEARGALRTIIMAGWTRNAMAAIA